MISYLILLILSITYLIFTYYVSNKVDSANYKIEKRKAIHKKLIWLFPFLGPLLIKSFWQHPKEEPLKIITKKERKTDPRGFYESGIGRPG